MNRADLKNKSINNPSYFILAMLVVKSLLFQEAFSQKRGKLQVALQPG